MARKTNRAARITEKPGKTVYEYDTGCKIEVRHTRNGLKVEASEACDSTTVEEVRRFREAQERYESTSKALAAEERKLLRSAKSLDKRLR